MEAADHEHADHARDADCSDLVSQSNRNAAKECHVRPLSKNETCASKEHRDREMHALNKRSSSFAVSQ
jgi:hypothetical protein